MILRDSRWVYITFFTNIIYEQYLKKVKLLLYLHGGEERCIQGFSGET
jgi:hypothetical protein